MEKVILASLLALASLTTLVQGHGYMSDPPQRNSAWRAGFSTPTDFNDMANFCGGASVQHNAQNQGRCGVCGEEYSNPNKKFEPGRANKFATGTIVGEFNQGETIDIKTMITAFHKGYHEYRLCENNVPQVGKDASAAVTQDCFDEHLLASPEGETRFPAVFGLATHKVVLSRDVSCSNCVLQWRYRTGNNWGCEDDGTYGLGYGPQEEFWGCSDIMISPGNGVPVPTNVPSTFSTTPTITTPSTTTPISKTTTTKTTPTTTRQPTTGSTATPTTTKATTTTITPKVTTGKTEGTATDPTTTIPTGLRICRGYGVYTGVVFDKWCMSNCNHIPAFCPPSHCICDN